MSSPGAELVSRMRIVILTQYYPPEIGAPQNRLSDLARRFVERDHRVQVLTAMPNYPGSEVFPEYGGRWVVAENIDGVPVVRVRLYVPDRKTFWKRILHYVSFALHVAMRAFFLWFVANAPGRRYIAPGRIWSKCTVSIVDFFLRAARFGR